MTPAFKSTPAQDLRPPQSGAIGKAGVPVVNESAACEPGNIGSAVAATSLRTLVALPVVCEGAVSEVLALYF